MEVLSSSALLSKCVQNQNFLSPPRLSWYPQPEKGQPWTLSLTLVLPSPSFLNTVARRFFQYKRDGPELSARSLPSEQLSQRRTGPCDVAPRTSDPPPAHGCPSACCPPPVLEYPRLVPPGPSYWRGPGPSPGTAFNQLPSCVILSCPQPGPAGGSSP